MHAVFMQDINIYIYNNVSPQPDAMYFYLSACCNFQLNHFNSMETWYEVEKRQAKDEWKSGEYGERKERKNCLIYRSE